MQSTDFEWLWHCQWKFVNCNTCTTLWGCWQWGKLCICWGSECRKSLPSSQFCREPKTPLKNSLHKNQYTLLNKGNKEIKLVRDHQKVQSVKERLELYWDFLPDEIRMERTLEKFRFGEKQQLFGHKYSSWGNLWILNFPQLPTHTLHLDPHLLPTKSRSKLCMRYTFSETIWSHLLYELSPFLYCSFGNHICKSTHFQLRPKVNLSNSLIY